MHKHTAAEMGKSKQIRDAKPKSRDKWASQENCFFPGHVVKNLDYPRNYGTDGPLEDSIYLLYFVCFVFHLVWLLLLVRMLLFLYFCLSFLCLYYHITPYT